MGKGLLVALIVVVALVVVAGAWVGVAFGLTRATGPVVTQDRTIPAFTKV